MAFSADAVANAVLQLAEDAGRPITNMEVQKHVFYAHAWHLAIDPKGDPLISDPIEAWAHGPVIRSLYREFSQYGKWPIDGHVRAKELKYLADSDFEEYEPSLEDEFPESGIEPEYAKTLVKWVWDKYSKYSAFQLSALTHAEGEPWRKVKDKYPEEMPRGLHIPNQLIRECFLQKLHKETGQRQTT